jgi:signal peptidase
MSPARRQRSRSDRLARVAGVAAVLLVATLVAGDALGQPVLVGYVETGSMAPQLQPGDGFLAVPAALTSTAVGDVVVFDAAVVNDGALTTHRVVDATPEGYVTRGDANRFTDQEGREPPVVDAQVVAEVVQVGGLVVPIPKLGVAVTGMQDLIDAVRLVALRTTGVDVSDRRVVALAIFLCGLGAFALGRPTDGHVRTHGTDGPGTGTQVPVRTLVAVGLVAVLVTTTAVWAVPSGPRQYDVVSADIDAPGIRVVEAGTTERAEHSVTARLVPTVVYLDSGSDALTVETRRLVVPAGETQTATFAVAAPVDRGYYRYYLVEHRYPAVFPERVLDGLYGVHPWTPTVAVAGLVTGAYLLVALPLVRLRTHVRLGRRRRPRRVRG